MIELTKYIPPTSGGRFTTRKIWINPKLIAYMEPGKVIFARAKSGEQSLDMIPVVFITFAEKEIDITVTNTPEDILKTIHYWNIDNTPGYKGLHE
jgi:hypothetical protein